MSLMSRIVANAAGGAWNGSNAGTGGGSRMSPMLHCGMRRRCAAGRKFG